MRRASRYAFLLFLLCALTLCGDPARGLAESATSRGRVVRVGWYETDGTGAGGYYYEYLQALSQYTGWTYEYVDGTWDECLAMLEAGKVDIVGFVQKNAEREAIFGYPGLPMAVTSGVLVTENDAPAQVDPASLDGLRVGVVKGNAYNADFEKYRQERGFSVAYVEYDSFSGISLALQRGEIDAAVVAEEDKTDTERILVNFASYSQYFATDIDDPAFLRALDDAMAQVNAFCPYLNSDLYKKYFSVQTDGKPVFTAEELAFIQANPAIPVLYDAGWPPIEYLDADTGAYKGISPDLFALLSEKCGISFVYEGSTSGAVLAELQDGQTRNALTTISYDYAWADKHDVYITQPFISSNIVKLGRNPDAADPTVAVNENAFFTYLLADELRGKRTLHFAKQSQRLEAVRTGEADYTFVTEDQANYYRSIPKYADLKTERMVGYAQEICIAVEKNSDPALMTIISKALASVTHDEMTALIRNNTLSAYEMTLADNLYKHRVQFVIGAFLAAALAAALIVVSNIRRKSAEKIRKALAVAEKASAAKGSFMSRMSHEIRTPLNAVIGYNMIARNELSDAKTDAERRTAEMKTMDCLTKSDIASRHLLTIINDVLDMSAIESGKIKIARERFDFKGLITSLTTIFYSQARAKGVDLEVVIDALTDEWFMGDQMRMNQILTNLLSNAIKFTQEGGSVTLIIGQTDAGIHFEVTDTGIGMTEEYLTHIWTPFEQADSSISRRFGGTGLGLSITKTLVDLMRGSIKVESQPGVGTKFTVELPLDKAEKPSNAGNYDFTDINALVVDDDANTCDYVRLLFNRCGARSATVTSGTDALEAMRQSIVKHDPFTLCLVDWRMPKMDGIETAKRIREIAGTQLPIIVLTAYDYTELADKADGAGVTRFLSKPLFQSSLFDLLANVGGVRQEKPPEKDKKYDFGGVRVLLAEDNRMNMEIASRMMNSVGLVVDSAWDGAQAVDKFTKSEPGTYLAILMDVHMPVMNGYEATGAIRASSHKEARAIPIIAMTADAFTEDVAQARAAGMNDHIAKPIEFDALFGKLCAIRRDV